MVFEAVKPEIKDKVISAHLSGLGRNEIVRTLQKEGLNVSAGSVSNFISDYKRKHQETSPFVATTNTAVDLNKGGSPSSIGVVKGAQKTFSKRCGTM